MIWSFEAQREFDRVNLFATPSTSLLNIQEGCTLNKDCLIIKEKVGVNHEIILN